MVFFNYALRKLNAKIVYYGPGLCGKTTNLVWIHDHFEGGERGKMISLATEGDRTIFFDLLPIEIGSIRGMNVTLQLYTVPGQVHYNSTRQLVLRGADGVVFVADSQRTMQSSNIDSFKNLQENLLLQGISLDGFPHALQFNKRDLRDIVPVEELDDDLNVYRVPIFEAVATEGIGVQETLEGMVKLVMRSLRERYEGMAAGARSPGIEDSAVSRPPTGMAGAPPGPTTLSTAESPAAAPPVGEVGSQELGAETIAFPQARAPDAFDGGSALDLEDEISTGVYDLGDGGSDAPLNLGLPPQSEMPPPEPEPPVEAFSDDDMESVAADSASSPSVPDVVGDFFAEVSSDAGITASGVDDLIASGDTEIPDFDADIPVHDLDIPLDDIAPDFEAPMAGAELEVELEAPPAAEEPDIPEFEVPPIAEESDIPEFEVPPIAEESDIPEFEVPAVDEEPAVAGSAEVESLSVDAEISGLEVTPPAATSEFPEIEFISTPEKREIAPPSADLPPPSERYEDRIEAPSPFAPHPQASAGAEGAAEALDTVEDREAEIAAEVEPVEAAVEAVEPATEVEAVEAKAEVEAVETATEVEAVEPATEVEAVEAATEVEAVEPATEVEAVEAATEVEAVEIAIEKEPAIAEAESYILDQAALEPIVLGSGEPWSEEEISGIHETEEIERIENAAIEPAPRREVAVRAEDNQLHLRLHGTGAIIESGQVRELDIAVPVPGSWVGNRRVTLQLRLTLTPDTEDENGGSGSPS